MDHFIPDIYQKSIYAIDYQALKEKGIRCLIFDLTNTLCSYQEQVPSQKLKDLFAYLENLKFKIIILSNHNKGKVAPFKEKLNVDASYKNHKPFKKKYLKILNLYHFEVHEVAGIGDEILVDVFGANRMGFTSILVNPISQKDEFGTCFFRFWERILLKKMKKMGILERGKYYE
ncbi:MAG: YqeG family HAD IIIA-type phosphatase [Bacilli bacterium]|nr:YqeG family HAD IIIA-type phosphatase [Bacilli bacterium]